MRYRRWLKCNPFWLFWTDRLEVCGWRGAWRRSLLAIQWWILHRKTTKIFKGSLGNGVSQVDVSCLIDSHTTCIELRWMEIRQTRIQWTRLHLLTVTPHDALFRRTCLVSKRWSQMVVRGRKRLGWPSSSSLCVLSESPCGSIWDDIRWTLVVGWRVWPRDPSYYPLHSCGCSIPLGRTLNCWWSDSYIIAWPSGSLAILRHVMMLTPIECRHPVIVPAMAGSSVKTQNAFPIKACFALSFLWAAWRNLTGWAGSPGWTS